MKKEIYAKCMFDLPIKVGQKVIYFHSDGETNTYSGAYECHPFVGIVKEIDLYVNGDGVLTISCENNRIQKHYSTGVLPYSILKERRPEYFL